MKSPPSAVAMSQIEPTIASVLASPGYAVAGTPVLACRL